MLETHNLSVFYAKHQAVADASVKVERGEIVVMLGANGAGKSTLLRAIAGLNPAAKGSAIVINGRNITGAKPHEIVEAGIALVPEDRGVFAALTVAENLALGAYPNRARKREKDNMERVLALFPKLAERRGQQVRTMSGGERQMVAIGRAMMSDPEVLLLDEPSLGLSPLLCGELFRSLAHIRQTGVGVFLVEQNARQGLAIADRGYLLDNGHITHEDSAAALARDPAVIHAYLGGGGGGGHAVTPARPGVEAPAAMPLRGFDAGQLARAAAGLAHRAGVLQAVHMHLTRHQAAVPSAFVGRYERAASLKAAQSAMAQLDPAPAPGPKIAPDAMELSHMAAGFAQRASAISAAHLRATRLSAPTPSAFGAQERMLHDSADFGRHTDGAVQDFQALQRAELSRMAGALADQAGARAAAHARRHHDAPPAGNETVARPPRRLNSKTKGRTGSKSGNA